MEQNKSKKEKENDLDINIVTFKVIAYILMIGFSVLGGILGIAIFNGHIFFFILGIATFCILAVGGVNMLLIGVENILEVHDAFMDMVCNRYKSILNDVLIAANDKNILEELLEAADLKFELKEVDKDEDEIGEV